MSSDEVYIGSVTPTIGVAEQRALAKVTRQMCGLLTNDEFVRIMNVYNNAIDRILKENGVESNDS